MSPDPGAAGAPRYPTIDVPQADAGSPEGVVRFLVGELASPCGIPAEQIGQVIAEVMRRETLGSTGIGGGVAIPHAASDAIAQVGVVIGRLPAPLDWHAIDGEPVRLVCLLLSPRANPGARLRHLEELVRTLRDRADGV